MNMRKIAILISTILILVSVIGCNKESGDIMELVSPLEQDISNIFTEQEVVTIPVIDITQEENIKGKKVEFEKKDMTEFAKYNAFNRLRSRIRNENQQSLFCVDPNTGVIYFINQNKDWFIYQLYKGKVEVVVELPARELYMWKGTLYFIVEDYDQYDFIGISENDIYAYTPADGNVKFVYAAKELDDAVESHLSVDEYGLHFYCSREGAEIEYNGVKGYRTESFYYTLPFGCDQVVEDIYRRAVSGWGDYYLHLASSTVSYLKHRNSEVNEKIELDGQVSQCCIMDDKFYYIDSEGMTFHVTDIMSGETKSYECKPILKELIGADIEKEHIAWIQSFTVINDNAWLVVRGKYLIRIELESNNIQCFVVNRLNYYIEKLYTDGKDVYALYKQESFFNPGYLVRVKTGEVLEVSNVYGVPQLAIEYLTE